MPESKLKVLKFKRKDAKIMVTYEVPNGKSADEVTLTSLDLPSPGLVEALDALKDDVLDMLELPITEDERERVTVTGVTVSPTENATGYTITALRALEQSNTPMNLVTPCKFDNYPSGGSVGDPKQLIDQDTEVRIGDLLLEVQGYVTQKRDREARKAGAQRQLPLDVAPADGIPEDDTTITLSFQGHDITMSPEKFDKALDFVAKLAAKPTPFLEQILAECTAQGNTKLASVISTELRRRGVDTAEQQAVAVAQGDDW